uniref:Uncharacterized protein n=1 Tax=Leersia perrieri TaxID=77586 RepID=A0A0D9Y044_9ORYZ
MEAVCGGEGSGPCDALMLAARWIREVMRWIGDDRVDRRRRRGDVSAVHWIGGGGPLMNKRIAGDRRSRRARGSAGCSGRRRGERG